MSFVTKLCTTFLQNGFKGMAGKAGTQLSPAATRNFHMMVKPIPRTFVETSSMAQNLVASATVSPISLVTGLQRLLTPSTSLLNQVAGFKVKGRLRRRCKDCYFVIRQQRHYVICPTHPRHKQMSMKKRDYKSWILTHATQSKVRPY